MSDTISVDLNGIIAFHAIVAALIIYSTILGGLAPAIVLVLHPLIYFAESRTAGLKLHANTSPSLYHQRIVVVLHFAVLCTAIFAATVLDRSMIQAYVVAVACGTLSGVFAVVAAHELIHSKRKSDRILGQALYTIILYPHFPDIHQNVHHGHFGTCQDIQTPRQGEDVFSHFVRAYSEGAVWGLRRPTLRARYTAIVIAIVLLITLFGWSAFVLVFFSGMWASFLLELTNFCQHGGLKNTASLEEHPEQILDDTNPVSLALLFGLGDHAKHHGANSSPGCVSKGFWHLALEAYFKAFKKLS